VYASPFRSSPFLSIILFYPTVIVSAVVFAAAAAAVE
jgi:hypothetical protein